MAEKLIEHGHDSPLSVLGFGEHERSRTVEDLVVDLVFFSRQAVEELPIRVRSAFLAQLLGDLETIEVF